MPALYAKLALTDNLSVDAFNQFELRPNAYPGCGTFLSTSDYAQPGCNQFLLNGSILSSLAGRPIFTPDGQALNNPLDSVARGPDHRPSDNQYGAGLHYLWDNVGMFGLYFADYTSRDAITQVVRTGPGVLTPPAANLGQATPTGVAAEQLSEQNAQLTRSEQETGRLLELAEKSRNALLSVLEDEQRLGKELRRWADAFENCAQGILIGTPGDAGIFACNQAFASLHGSAPEDIRHRH